MNDGFQGFQERRQDPNNQAAAIFMKEVREELTALRKEVAHLDRSVTYYRSTQDEAIERAIDKAIEKSLKDAFPNGDPDGHRRAHEAAIRKAERTAEFLEMLIKEAGKWGLLSVLGWLVYIAWQAFLRGPSK